MAKARKKLKSYEVYRSRLMRKGFNIRKWALENDLPPALVYDALKGRRSGPGAKSIIQKVEEFIQ